MSSYSDPKKLTFEAKDIPVFIGPMLLASELPAGVSYIVGDHGTVLGLVSTCCRGTICVVQLIRSAPLVDQPGCEGYDTQCTRP